MVKKNGTFVISLDFELYWGMRDKKKIEDYRKNLLGVRRVIPSLLKLFDECRVHATWATVGFLFFRTRDELIDGLPAKRPIYIDSKFSPYGHINNIGTDEKEDPFHYAPSLIETIRAFSPSQEIGSHTFSHYYCLEKGQDMDAFRKDLEAAIRVAKRYDLDITSLVFPRNQTNSGYLSVCRKIGIKAYRGNSPYWIYKASDEGSKTLWLKALRLLDTYFNISGHNCYSLDEIGASFPFNITSSRFLRSAPRLLNILEPLRLRRILSSMTYAAKKGLVYHLWWHPHNFGVNIGKNSSFLKRILSHYMYLREQYGMKSFNMKELSDRLIKKGQYEG